MEIDRASPHRRKRNQLLSGRASSRSTILLTCLVLFMQASTVQGYVKDKSALYDKYPQLISEDTDPCVRGINQVFINMRTEVAQEIMAQTSMHGLNDLGSLAECENGTFGDLSTYSILQLNVTHIPVKLISGVCLPKACTQEQLTRFSDKTTNQVNNLLIKAQKRFDFLDLTKGYGLVKDYSRLTVAMVKSDQAAEEWDKSVDVGYIIALCFCSAIFVAFCLAPNIYLLICHFRSNKQGVVVTPQVDWALQSTSKQIQQEKETHTGVSPKIQDGSSIMTSTLLRSVPDQRGSGRDTFMQNSVLRDDFAATQRMTEAILRTASGAGGASVAGDASVVRCQSLANSLYESRVTYKFKPMEFGAQHNSDSLQKMNEEQGSNSCGSKFLSFSIVRSWKSLSSSKCKLWDDDELDIIEGAKFFSFFLGQLCITAQFLMCTQTINPWMIQRFFQELLFTIVISSNIVMEAFTTLSAFLGAYKLFCLYEAQGHISGLDILKFWARKYLRLAPMYYFIFFAGWAIFPHLGAGPIWYQASLMYDECDKYWWAQLLMIGNIYPYFQAPNYGCFFWGWTITTDMQLALLTPLFVIVYKKREWAGHLLVALAVIIDTIFIGKTCLDYGLRAGPFAEENWYLFSYLFQKPFFKVNTFAIGVFAAYIYMQILDFRRISDENVRKNRYPKINFIHHSPLAHTIIFLLGFGMIMTNLLIGHSGVAAPYSWSMAQNAAYFTMTRITYALGIHMILFVFFTGGFTFGKVFMGRPIFRVLGKLSFESALITPMMVQLIYSQLPNGLFVQFNKVLELGLGNVVCVMVAGTFLYLIFEFPFKRIIDFTLLPYCSHDEILHLNYVRRKASSGTGSNMKVSTSGNESVASLDLKKKSPQLHFDNVDANVYSDYTHTSQGESHINHRFSPRDSFD